MVLRQNTDGCTLSEPGEGNFYWEYNTEAETSKDRHYPKETGVKWRVVQKGGQNANGSYISKVCSRKLKNLPGSSA